MSIRQMSLVWALDLPPSEKFVLLKMADHASDDGGDCYPSIGTIANHTSMSRRSVQRHIRALEAKGLLVKVADAPPQGAGACYQLRLERGVKSDKRGDRVTPLGVTNATERGDKGAIEGRHSDALTIIEPSKNHQYAFEGEVIRLTERDFERWQKAYPRLDLAAELQSLDDYYRGQPEDVRRAWFHRASGALKKRNAVAKPKGSEPRRARVDVTQVGAGNV